MFEITVPYLLKRAAFKHPHKEAIVSEAGRWTFQQWERNSNRLAHALARLGIGQGDHVATIFLNGREVLETYLALMKLGAIIVPLNVRLAPLELRYIVDHSDATTLILDAEFEPLIRKFKDDLLKVRQFIKVGGEPAEDMTALDGSWAGESDLAPETMIRETDTAAILYTGGTTGLPKGVILSHKNCIWASVNIFTGVDIQPDYRVLMVFPLYHAAAFLLLISDLFGGCTNVTMRSFDPTRVMELIEQEKINRMTFPPTVWNFILQLPDLDRYDTASVRALSSGAESIPLETKKGLLRLFPNAGLGETYGMTESTATITTLHPRDAMNKMASVGKPFMNVEIRLVDDDDREVRQGEVGEILARGPNIMEGYYREPEATAETMRGGWLHTGDLGRLDEDGFLYIVDRKKDMIISGGENIIPREIEEVLYTHPKILEAAVIGMPDPDWGERIHAVVALKEGERMTDREVVDYCLSRIASFKKPKSVDFVERLPRSAAGKVLKRVLRDQRVESAGTRA
ncbi:MAG: long-chain-fatty-acid--CoA ligase [Proteobacteria bacterium]|nr:long-chain-fatty-acid--CoA ligase [Pseudomonadota bacterium]